MDEIKGEYEKVKATLTVVAPFISSLMSRVRIVLTDEVKTAAINKDGVMLLSPTFWRSLSWAGKAWILSHETLHIAFRDHRRMESRDRMLWNCVTDAVNNDMINEFLKTPEEIKGFCVSLSKLWEIVMYMNLGINYDDFKKMSKEEIYRLFEKQGYTGNNLEIEDLKQSKADGKRKIPNFERDLNVEDEARGEVLQEGDPSIYRDGKEEDGEEVNEKWKDFIARAYDLQKSIGNVPAGLKRIVDDILKPKVDWRSLLKQALKTGFGKTVVSTWKRPSRKHSDFPGLRRYTYPMVWTLIDASGSISRKELTQFISEVYSIAGNSSVTVIVWDVDVHEVINAKNKADVINKVVKKIRGGGGTVILPALKTVLEKMKPRDIVVILSDMDIFDLKLPRTVKAFNDIAAKSSMAVICSTKSEVNIDGWRFIKISNN